MDSMQILSRLYDILSQSDVSDLKQAATIAGNPDLTKSVDALIAYKQRASRKSLTIDGSQEKKKIRKSKPVAYSEPKRIKGAQSRPTSKLAIVITSQEYFANNRELIQYLKDSKLPFSVSPKLSRKQILTRIHNWLSKLPLDQERTETLNLLRLLPKSETSGWFEAIRGQ